jgi:Rrf2 family protein
MQVTRQADYALRAMLYLARLYSINPNQRASTSKIAETQQIPLSFLAKIISQLSIARLVTTVRGAKGGVNLARSPEEISLLDVVEAIEGPISLSECSKDPSNCAFGNTCPIHEIWCEAENEVIRKLKQATFDVLLEREKALME